MKKIVWALSLMLFVSMSSMAQGGGGTPPGGGGGGQPGGNQPGGGGNQPGGQGGGTTATDATIAGLTDFTVAFNTAALSESETIPSGDEKYVENVTFNSGTITVVYNGSTATVSGAADGDVTVSGADVTINSGSYNVVLSGTTTDGSLTIATSKATAIYLNGVTLQNADGAAINQTQKKYITYIIANEGTTNILTDGSRNGTSGSGELNDPKVKGAIFTKGAAIFSGKGSLTVNGYFKNGIDTKKSLVIRPNTNVYITLTDTIQKGSCIKCEDSDTGEGLYMLGGVLNLSNPTVAGKGLASDGEITISGGRLTAICTGTGLWEGDEDIPDVSGSAGVKCDGIFTMTEGDLWLMSTGNGGKGMSCDSTMNFNGGTVHAKTTGSTYQYTYNNYIYDSSPKGIKTDRDIYVTGGEIYVCATGTTDGSEGIEAKQTYNQSGGTVKVYAADDAINTGYSGESSQNAQEMTFAIKKQLGLIPSDAVADAGQLNVSGGTLYTYSTSNDAMDSNGTISISGGNVIAFGAGAPETSIDCDQDNKLSVTGGNIFGLGGAAPNTPGASCTQCYAVIGSFTSTANTTYTLKDASGTEIMSVEVPRAYSGGSLVVSSPDMAKGTTYTIGSSSFTTSSSSWITSSTSGGQQPGGGGQPGPGTGIDTVTSNTQDLTSDAIYDMTGRRPSAVPPRGMYIRNGKKFIVR